MQQAIFWTVEEVAARAKKLYADNIRSIVEHEDNIGKMVVIDAETGEYTEKSENIVNQIRSKPQWHHVRLFQACLSETDFALSFKEILTI